MSEKPQSQRGIFTVGAVLVAVVLFAVFYFVFGAGSSAPDDGRAAFPGEKRQGAPSPVHHPDVPKQVASGGAAAVAPVPPRADPGNGPGAAPTSTMSPATDVSGGKSTPAFPMRARNATPTPDAAREPYKIREETRDIEGPSLMEVARQFKAGAALEMAFPLFDGEQVVLTDVRLESIDARSGVFLAKVHGEPGGGHVALSYVNDIMDGEIHIPSQNRYFILRTTGGGTPRNVLAQLDGAKMPRCGSCPPVP
ncbi:MAG: hypothetical protein LBD14_02900 [Puniceicoccales bacterium]|jgi:hypothetical protein|nr:hypothetical protein [Puniceicoccales bacterium]